jgi:hypothetical protein
MERLEAIPTTRTFAIAVVAIALLLGGAALWGVNEDVLGLFHDDGIYTVVAKSLYQGDGYRIISVPSAPPQTKYPFLYAYLLSWIWAIAPAFPQNVGVLKTLNVAILVAIFFIGVVYYQRSFPGSSIGAIVFAVVICTNPIVFTFTDYVVSDLLYVLLALGALTICSGYIRAFSRARQLTLLLAVISGLACLTRLAAVPLAFAASVQAFMSCRWKGLAYVIAGVFLFIAPWLIWVSLWQHHAPDSLLGYYSAYDLSSTKLAEHGTWFVRQRIVILSNARYLLDSFDFLYLLPLLPGLGFLVAPLTAAGMIASARREDAFNWCFFLSSVGILLIWPFQPTRYVAPLVPLLVMFLFRGMQVVQRWIESIRREFILKGLLAKIAWFPALLILLLNAVWLSGYLLIGDERSTRGVYGSRLSYGWRGFEETFAWIRNNTQADALLATAYDPMYYLYTGRQAIRPALHRSASYFYPYGQASPDVGSIEEIKPQLEKLGVKYLLIDPLDGFAEGKATIKLLGELVSSYGARARNVFTSSDGKHRIYVLQSD